jgi:TetR/AcrR family transcriptional regulator
MRRSTTNETVHSADQRIFMAAQELFAEKGFWGTSVQEITDKAAVNKAMLFYYFKSKENLYLTLLEEILSDMQQRARKRIKRKKDPAGKLMAILEYYDDLLKKPEHFRTFKIIFQDIMGPDEKVKESLKGHFLAILGIFEDIVKEGIEKGAFRKADPHLEALSILGMLYIFARHRYILGEKFQVEEISSYIHNTILKGIQR